MKKNQFLSRMPVYTRPYLLVYSQKCFTTKVHLHAFILASNVCLYRLRVRKILGALVNFLLTFCVSLKTEAKDRRIHLMVNNLH